MSTHIPEEIIENIRKENDIVDVVEEYVSLKRQGRNHVGLCPFHDEKTPSFTVSKDKQLFRCFGCGKGGSVFNFLMELESFNFIEAVHHLANKVNIALPDTQRKERSISEEGQTFLSAYHLLTKYYHYMLKGTDDGQLAQDYLLERGITKDTIETFQLGYSPSNSEITLEFLQEKGFHRQSLVKAGLISTHDNEHFADVFRGRVIFPIRNHLGKPVAFGGRSYQGEEPKYLNSPEHELFQKGNILFNFDLAKRHVRRENEAIVFEGYMDVIAAHQANVTNTVATLGTALTTNQARLLKRYVETVVICYDADHAGAEASYQAAQLLEQVGANVKVAQMPDGMDPDDYINEHGGEVFQEQIINRSDSLIRFYMNYKRKKYDLSIEDNRIAYIEEVIVLLATIESSIELEFYVNEIAEEFNLSTDIIHHDIDEHKKSNNRQHKGNQPPPNHPQPIPRPVTKKTILPAHTNAERFLLAHMLQNPNIIHKVQQTLGVQFNVDEHKVILTHLYALHEKFEDINVSQVIDNLTDDHLKEIVMDVAMIDTEEMITEEVMDDYIKVIQAESTDVAYLRILERKQKQESNPILAAKIGLEILEIKKQLQQLR